MSTAIILSLHLCLVNASPAQTPDAAMAPAGLDADVSTQTQSDAPEKKSASEPFVQVGVDDRITLHISGLPLSDALRMLSEPTKKNIILGPGADGVVSATLYDATFDEALRAMLVANGLGYVSEGNFIYIHPIAEIEKMKSSSRKVVTRVVHLSYARAADVQALIEPLRSESGSIAMTPPSNIGLGGDAGPADTEGNVLATADTIVITDYSDVVERMLSIIREVDTRPQQALIEATILRATLNENNAMGIDFTVVGGIDFTALNSTSPAAQSITTGQTPQNVLGDTTLTARTNFNNAVPGGGFTFGIIKDQIGVFVRALEAVTDTDVIANPKVLALNKQFGQVIVGRRDGYITTTITETTSTQTVEFLETGTILTFRPYIGDDGFVRMEIHPKDSTGGLTASNLPFEQTTEVTTNIMVRDGHTILIGGLFREVTTAGREQTPLLGDLPGLGPLFRVTTDTTVREEVIVLLTVHIVKDPYDFEKGESLYQDVERVRLGARAGVQPIGRERISEQYYTKALARMDKGDLDGAAWYARLALNHFPRHVHASQLLDKIRGQRSWESEASSIRSAVRELIVEEQGRTPPPPFERPAAPPFDTPEWLNLDRPSNPKPSEPPAATPAQEAVVPVSPNPTKPVGSMKEVSR
ncbi:MAG TPA: hypothetical protein P5081_12440 [Phycisphaerae bacterium]|nr:hypothetical protein [Phycisphaerae bacterium]HRW53685.1 hypothetical protein [Phycisphaerae bacterium]